MTAGDATHKVLNLKGFQSCYFDGIDDYLINNSLKGYEELAGNNDWTFHAKIRIKSHNFISGIGSQSNGNGIGVNCLSTGVIVVSRYVSPVYTFSSMTFELNKEYDIAITYSKTSGKTTLYVDGIKIEEINNTEYDLINSKLAIGAPISLMPPTTRFNGCIGEVMWFSRNFNHEEMIELTTGATQKFSRDNSLIGYYPLKKNYLDYSKNNNELVVKGTNFELRDETLQNEIKTIRKTANDTYLLAPLKDGQISLVNIEGAAA